MNEPDLMTSRGRLKWLAVVALGALVLCAILTGVFFLALWAEDQSKHWHELPTAPDDAGGEGTRG